MIFVIYTVECKEERNRLSEYPKEKTYPLRKNEGAAKTIHENKTEEGVRYTLDYGVGYYDKKVIKYTSKQYETYHIIMKEEHSISMEQFENYTYYEGVGCKYDESSSFYWFDNKEAVKSLPVELKDCGLEADQYSFKELKSKCNYSLECISENVYFFKVETDRLTTYLTNDTENIQIRDFDMFETYGARSYSEIDSILNFLPQPSDSLLIIPSLLLIIISFFLLL